MGKKLFQTVKFCVKNLTTVLICGILLVLKYERGLKMAIITYDRTIVISAEEAEIIAEVLDRPAVPIPEDATEKWKESMERGRQWMKQFSNTPQST